ncbi:MAG: type IV secretory system conjugative DNA transfer family protein [Pseudomonadota bacterium]
MPRQIKAGLFLGFFGLLVGYVLVVEFVNAQLFTNYDFLTLAFDWERIMRLNWDVFLQALAIMFACFGVAAAFGAHSATQALTRVGKTNWQSAWALRWNGLLGAPGDGFVVAKTTRPFWPGRYLIYEEKPHCIVIAPSGEGKGVGFVYPNLFTFKGSTVTLDIKGENYDTTARWRHKMGAKVFLFAPVEFEELSHRYNPLDRVGKLTNPAERQLELEQISTLFLQGERNLETWIEGAREMFVAAGGIAFQRGRFTLGGIYDVCVGAQSTLKDYFGKLRDEAQDDDLKKELNKLAVLDEKTLSGYLSVMMTAGFKQWKNPHIRKMTDVSDFSFDNIRRKKMSVYFKVSEPKLKVIAPLVRLFFNELVATMQSRLPAEDETNKVMIILDEFQALGRMDTVADAMATIRGFGGRIAIITQTIPQLDSVYDENRRLVIQGNAGLKLYMTPSDERTIEDVSNACGMTTRKVVSVSQRQGIGEKKTFSERTEEVPLLTKDDARQMKGDRAVVVVNGMAPIKAFRIRHFKDRKFKQIVKRSTELPWEPLTNSLLKLRVIEGTTTRAASTHPVNPRTEGSAEGVPVVAQASSGEAIPTTEDAQTLRALVDRLFELIERCQALPEQAKELVQLRQEYTESEDLPNLADQEGKPDYGAVGVADPQTVSTGDGTLKRRKRNGVRNDLRMNIDDDGKAA